MKLKERLEAIKELEKLSVPFDVRRIFGEIELFGAQVCFGKANDFAELSELRYAIAYLVDELGGTVKWDVTKAKKKVK